MRVTDVQPRIELFLDDSWIDLTDRLLQMDGHRGKGHPQDDQSVGVCELRLRNHDGLINAETFEPGLPGRVTYLDIGTTRQLAYGGAGVFANWAGSSVVDVPDPDGIEAGDLVLASIGFNHEGNITAPAGWSTIWDHAGPDGSAGQYFRISDGGPPADIRWLIDSGVTDAGGVSTGWRAPAGFDPAVSPTSANAGDWPSTSEPRAWDGFIPPPNPGASVVAFYQAPESPVTVSPPLGWSHLVDISGGTNQVFCGLAMAPLGFNGRTAPSWDFGSAQPVVVGAALLTAIKAGPNRSPFFVFEDQLVGTNVVSPDFDIDTLDAGFTMTGRIATQIVPAAPGARIVNVWSGSQTNRKMQMFMRDDSSLRFQVQTTSGGVSLTTGPLDLTGDGLTFVATYTLGGVLTFSVGGAPPLTNPGPLDPLQTSTLPLTVASRADLGEAGTGWLGLVQDLVVSPAVGSAIRLDGEDVGIADGDLDGVSWTEGAGGHTWDASGAVSLVAGVGGPLDVFLGTTLRARFSREYEAKNRTVTISLQDDTRLLTNAEEAAWPDGGDNDTVAERVDRLLDVADWSHGREIGGGFGQFEPMEDGTSVADEMFEAVQRNEVGQWAVLADQTFRQLSRDQLFDPERMEGATIIGRADLPISFGDASWSADRIINRAIGNRQQGGGQPNLIFEDDDSIAKYGVYADSFLEYSHKTNGETTAALQGEVSFYSLPTLDNDEVTAWLVRGDWPSTFYSIDLLDPLLVHENGQFRQCIVYGIDHEWSAQDGWSITFQLWQFVGGQLDDLLILDEGQLDVHKLGAGSRRGAPIVPT